MDELIINKETKMAGFKGSISSKFTKLKIFELISSLSESLKNIENLYDGFMSNDGKLVGQEKIVLVRNINELIEILILMSQLIKKEYIQVENKDYKVDIRLDSDNMFFLTFPLLIKDMDKYSTFKSWIDNTFLKNFQLFISKFKLALNDKVITHEEGVDLLKVIETILIDSLIIMHKLEHENIVN